MGSRRDPSATDDALVPRRAVQQTIGCRAIAAHLHHDPEPSILELTPGVVRFDVVHDLNVDGELDPDREVLEPAVVPGMRVRRLFRYVPPPGYRWR